MKVAARFLVSFGLLALMVAWIGFDEALAAFRDVRTPHIVAVAGLLVVFVALGVLNVGVLTLALEPGTSRRLVATSYLRSFALGMLAPGKVGDLTYSHFLSRAGAGHGLGLAVVVFDKTVTFAVLSLVGCFGLLLYVGAGQAAASALAVVIVTAGVLAIMGHGGIREWVRRRILRSHEEKFRGFSEYLRALRLRHRSAVAANILVTLVRLLVQASIVYVGFRAFGAQVEFWPATLVIAMVLLAAWIPVTLSGLGVTQGAAVLLFSLLLGADRAVVLDLFLVISVLSYLLAGAILATASHADAGEPADTAAAAPPPLNKG